MVMSVSNAGQTSLNTDYPQDKVVFKRSGQVSVPTATFLSDSVIVTIPHGLPFTPLCLGSYTTSVFSASSLDFGSGPLVWNSTFGLFMKATNVVAEADATNIYLNLINFGATATFQYRITALEPPVVSTPTTIAASPVQFGFYASSDDNYLKIYDQGTISVSESGAPGYDSRTVTHNLGYVPAVLLYSEWGGILRKYGDENAIGVSGVDAYATITTTALTVFFDTVSAGTFKIHYKIYLDA